MFAIRFLFLCAALMVPAPVVAAPAKIDAYLLTPGETDRMRRFDGMGRDDLFASTAISTALDRVFADVAGKAMTPDSERPETVLDAFRDALGVPDNVEILERRFLFTGGCQPGFCTSKSAFIVDLATGHLVMAHVGRVFEPRSPGYWVFILARKACADADLIRFVESRINRWRKDALRDLKPDERVREDILVTPCQPTVPAKPKRMAGKVEVHPLELPPVRTISEAERRRLRPLAGAAWEEVRERKGIPSSLFWGLHDLAGRGHYLATWRTAGFVSRRFFSWLRPAAPTALEQNRYFVASGCAETGCMTGSSILMVDLVTGQFAGGIVHEFDAAGTGFYDFGHLTIFRWRCADPAFAAFVQDHAVTWARQVLSARHGAAYPGLGAPTTVEAACD